MANPYWLAEEHFARLQPLLPQKVRGVPRVDARRVISGIIHVLQSGCRWRDAPPVYGPSKTLYNRFVRWARKGVWDRVFAELARQAGAAGGPPRALLLDSTPVQMHRAAAGGKGGRSTKPSGDPAGAARPKSTRPSMRPGARGSGSSAQGLKAMCPSRRPWSPS